MGAQKAVMRLPFLVIDPEAGADHCPAVFVDEGTGDLVFQGWTVTDARDLAQVEARSHIADDESVVRLPARMRTLVLEALRDVGDSAVQ
ncbi:hypothetical protein LO762_11475 [Actinocorallia sp. API 0066]|uniref:hypothetical protein n=1 Tax=Actinocorallia sp. API 0066 TaxID=2896846 RepID=UPI001E45DD43|nr:hypothetical protein [Actinocorallia sp. API 0066]MCD0449804.1 hypothetical protein [Actinocorallia sp. API 0066]